jgi:signal transduction histidine kinase/CheY-like chemotaxis protein
VSHASAGKAATAQKSAGGGRLLRKYMGLLIAVVCIPLIAIGGFGIWSSYRDHRASLVRLQREQADAAASKIGQFIKEVEGQIGWMSQLASSATSTEQYRFAARLLLRQVPAITELVSLDADGRERLRVSRLAMDAIGSGTDRSRESAFIETIARKVWYGPVSFRLESEPYMTLGVAGNRRDLGVILAEVNLKFIWDVVSQIKVGNTGRAYVADADGRLIAHPDISLVLRNTDLSGLAQVQAARGSATGERAQITDDMQGRAVLSAFAPIAPLGWSVFVELPLAEAYAPAYASLLATGLMLAAGLFLAVLSSFILARRMVTPIRALQTGAARIGAGALDHRIDIATGDELEALGEQFNSMAAQLQHSYATLEGKVEERTHQLRAANLAKSRFLAAASHDLRQPLHALGLFVAQLHAGVDAAERSGVVARIDAALTAMNELFNALLDISRLDADVLTPKLAPLPLDHVFRRLETTFAGAAAEKGLKFRLVPSRAWVRSDMILLERIMLNLASNAVRYTDRGGIVIGARRRGDKLRLDVCDSGIGIPEDQRQNVFAEFYQIADARQERQAGIGLGLAIVERLARLLDHPIELASVPGRGTRFSITLPLAPAEPKLITPAEPADVGPAAGSDTLVVIVDDDALVRDGMAGLVRRWGYAVVTADCHESARQAVAASGRTPGLIISDYQLANGRTGLDAIERLREAYGGGIPAFMISGDTAPERLRDARAGGYHLLHKPVQPMKLRAMMIQFLNASAENRPIGVPAGLQTQDAGG